MRQRQWFKSTYSADNGCVEVEFWPDGTVVLRDSKDRAGPKVIFDQHEWDAFVRGVKDGEFDQEVTGG